MTPNHEVVWGEDDPAISRDSRDRGQIADRNPAAKLNNPPMPGGGRSGSPATL